MKTLVVGATGATGRLLVQQLLEQGTQVKAVVRSPEKLPDEIKRHPNLTIVQASILKLDDRTLMDLVSDCDAVASCLGHVMTMRGIFGPPRKLVTDATRKLCHAIIANNPQKPVKFVLMNTSGNRNRDINESISFAEQLTIGAIRLLVPPQSDNEQAAEHLRVKVGKNNPMIEWAIVRPDSLINQIDVTPYETHPSPITSPIFKPGKTSRINVANFMANLITDARLWDQWKGQMPVLYNRMTA